MRNLWIVTFNELKRYFISPLAYVYLISFLALNGSFAIYFGHFFERGRADLLPMFGFQPWLYLLFIPGISMRLWAEEFRNKTVVQIMTMPLSPASLVWGKFFASWLFCALALLLTFPFWITVNLLGQPDNSVIILSYFGSLMLAGCMLAISQTMSALTKNQVIALVLSVITNLLFFLSSLEYVLSFFRLFFPLSIVDMIASFSFITHFATISTGLLELRDLLFFGTIILLFNFSTEIIISFKTSGTSRILKSTNPKHYILVFLFMLLGFIGLNLLANNYLRRIQYDFTQEKVFSLTNTTRQILQKLPHEVTAKLYYSPLLGQRNSEFRLYFDKIRLLMDQYRKISGGKFDYRVFLTEPLSTSEDYALSVGLQPLPIVDKSQGAFFGMVLNDSIDNQQKIPFFTLERQDFIEQDLSEAIFLLHNKKKKLGIISSLPLNSTTIENVITPRWEIMNQLDKFYDSQIISSPQQLETPPDVLMIVHPTGLTPEMVEAIKNYSYQGGKVLLFVDIAAESIRNFAPSSSLLAATDLKGLDKLWGFHYYQQGVVADLGNSITVDASSDYNRDTNFTQDVIQFLLKEPNFNPLDPSTRQLKKILFASTTVIEPDPEQDRVEFIPLITAGPNSSIMNANLVRNNVNPADLLRNFKRDNYHKIVAARLISRNLSKPFDVIVIGDSDILYDTYWGNFISLGEKSHFVPLLDNANFVLNSLESLGGSQGLIGLRGRSGKIRSFDGVEQIRKSGIRDSKIKEKEIMDNIDLAKAGIQEIWNKRSFEQRSIFTPDELALIAGIRKKLDALRQQLQKIRSQTNTALNHIDSQVKFYNIYAIPLLLLAGLSILALLRRRRQSNNSLSSSRLNQSAWYLIGFSTLLLGGGLLSVHYSNLNNNQQLIDQPVFPQLSEKINNVRKIILSGHNHKLTFYKQDGIWKIEGDDRQLVLQDRIRSFLSALLEATYYEKKSSQVEYLNRFGLQPIDQPGSPNIAVRLEDEKGRSIEDFEIGKYDLDIGRGSRAAYLKFAHQFQVWLVAADFIDLSVASADWTYSSLWNLRLGRLVSVNNQNNPYHIARIAGTLLNSQIISSLSAIDNASELFQFELLTEGNNQLIIRIFEADDQYYANYDFSHIPNENRLQLFEKYTKGNYYQISKTNMEKIKNVLRNTQ